MSKEEFETRFNTSWLAVDCVLCHVDDIDDDLAADVLDRCFSSNVVILLRELDLRHVNKCLVTLPGLGGIGLARDKRELESILYELRPLLPKHVRKYAWSPWVSAKRPL